MQGKWYVLLIFGNKEEKHCTPQLVRQLADSPPRHEVFAEKALWGWSRSWQRLEQ